MGNICDCVFQFQITLLEFLTFSAKYPQLIVYGIGQATHILIIT